MGNLQTFCLPYAFFYAQQDLPRFLVSSAALRQIVSPWDATPNVAGRFSPIGQSWLPPPPAFGLVGYRCWVPLGAVKHTASAVVNCRSGAVAQMDRALLS